MASKIQLRRGLKSALPTLSAGEPAYTTDTRELYVGTGSGNVNMGGSHWYTGTAMYGTSSTTGAYSYSACPQVKVGDCYLNTSYGYVYQCTTAGSGTGAKWTYKGSIKGATGATGATGVAGAAGADGKDATNRDGLIDMLLHAAGYSCVGIDIMGVTVEGEQITAITSDPINRDTKILYGLYDACGLIDTITNMAGKTVSSLSLDGDVDLVTVIGAEALQAHILLSEIKRLFTSTHSAPLHYAAYLHYTGTKWEII